MRLAAELNLACAAGAVALGAGALFRARRHPASRRFAVLCAALAVWNLGRAATVAGLRPEGLWWRMSLLGGIVLAPAALHLTLGLIGRPREESRRWVLPAYAVAAVLWGSVWTPLVDAWTAWSLTALAVLGLLLAVSLVLLVRHALSLEREPERGAFRLFAIGALVAVAVGLTDLIPWPDPSVPRIGSVAALFLLLIVCSIVVRNRFLDLDAFLARAVGLVLGAGAATVLLSLVVEAAGSRPLLVFAAALVALVAVELALPAPGPAGARARGLRREVADALAGASRKLAVAKDAGEVEGAVRQACAAMPPGTRVIVYLRDGGAGSLAPSFRSGFPADPPPLAPDEPLALRLAAETEPVTRPLLDSEAGSRDAAARLRSLGIDIAVPLAREGRFAGWAGLGGARGDEFLHPEVAASLLAVGNHATASLERIEAIEEARRSEALAAVGELAGGLAHEVRNPVAALRGAAEVLAESASPESSREMIGVIVEESARLERFVGEFLEYARPAEPRRETVDLVALLRATLREAELAGLGMTWHLEAPDCIPVRADPDAMRRVFANLIRNAREAAGAEGTLTVSLRRVAGGPVAIRFEDDGPGIPDEEISRLFRPFHTTKPGGTGLGLALVHRVIEAHGGTIRVEGRPGRGAAFTILLPAEGSRA